MPPSRVAVHVHELALKGRNRPRFERLLKENLRRSLRPLARAAGTGELRVRSHGRRIFVESEANPREIARVAASVCGVATAAPYVSVPLDLEAAASVVIEEVRRREPRNFRISSRRADKRFPMTSPEIDRTVGAAVHEATGVPVRLKGAELDVRLAVLEEEIHLATESVKGVGGLPVGSAGRVAMMLSGGIDSPVAAWRMLRRGCFAELVHFHSHPLVDRTSQEKARDLAEVLTRLQYRTRLHLVPLAPIQTRVRVEAPERLRVILYRRFMVRIAERIARANGCEAIVTGESLGQVASQTLANIATVDAVAELPVLRPLIGSDKQEIIEEAQRLGTFDISVRKDQDCCSLFVPSHPSTRTSDRLLSQAEQPFDVDALVAEAVEGTEVVELKYP